MNEGKEAETGGLVARVEAEAKARALAYLNANRVKDGLKPLDEVEDEYWEVYGRRWIAGETVQPRIR